VADAGSGAEAQIDALYELPLAEFTPARNRLAQQLRRGGDRELSDEVKRLPKPTAAAWTLNQLRRRRPELVSKLLDAGAQLRDAQERLLDEGERGVLRQAAAQERRLVEETVQAAEAMLRGDGQPVSAPLQRKLWEATHAAALDPELGRRLARGRLLEDRQISDLGLGGGSDGPALRSGSATRIAATPRGGSDSRARAQARRRLEKARQRQEQLDDRLKAAQRDADLADQQVAKARTELERAEIDAARRRADVDRAGEQAAAGAERLRELEAQDR
jgi:hypothetical protein